MRNNRSRKLIGLFLLIVLVYPVLLKAQDAGDDPTSVMLQRPVVNANGNRNNNIPPTVSYTVFRNGSMNRILPEDTHHFKNSDDNITGQGLFSVELGNFPDLIKGDSVTVRFTDRELGQQGYLSVVIDTIPWKDSDPFTALQLKSTKLPDAPRDVTVSANESGEVDLKWEAGNELRFAVYRKIISDTLGTGKTVFHYRLLADSLSSKSYHDPKGSTNDLYLIYARNSEGIWSPHSEIPTLWSRLRSSVPELVVPGHPVLKDMYYTAWKIGLNNTQHGTTENGFVDWYVDEAFDSRIFQWDVCFSLAWAKYSQGGMPNIHSLDNFYMKQHPDGAISGVIRGSDGTDDQPEDSPWFTRNNLFSWAEWEYYQTTGDSSRFDRVVPILADYARWVKRNRRHPNGHYYWSGWSSGMDNSPRSNANTFYPPYSWVDYDANEALAARYLAKMADVTGNQTVAQEFRAQHDTLQHLVNSQMWSAKDRYYWDLDKDGSFMKVKTVASFWPLWAKIADEQQIDGLVAHLNNPQEYNRPHRVPTLAADQPDYSPDGNYWRGSVWAPTNHMIVQGLMDNGRLQLARDIVVNHLQNVEQVYRSTGTFWENYAPETAAPGNPAKPNFVGWSALGPITQLIENYIGIIKHVPDHTIEWNLLTNEEVGLRNLQFGDFTIQEIRSDKRDPGEPVMVTINSEGSFDLELHTNRLDTTLHVSAGQSQYDIIATDIDPKETIARRVTLEKNYPNPFNPSTTIRFSLPEAMEVSINIYDVTGRLVAQPVDAKRTAGSHTVRINSASWSSGIYFYQLQTTEQTITRKMVLIK